MKWARLIREECAALAGWWLHEMREMIADLEQHWAPGKPYRTTIYLMPTLGKVERRWRNGTIQSAEFQHSANGDFSAESRDLLTQSAADGTPVHVVLPQSDILIRHLRLPTGAERSLASVIELQLERELPLARDQVQVDWRIEARHPNGTKIDVSIAAIRRGDIERLLDALSQWKLRVLSIAVDLGAQRTAFNFAPRRISRPSGQLARIDRWLTASAVALIAIFVAVVGAQWLRERFVVGAALAAADMPAQRVEHLRAELAKRSKPMSELLRLMQSPSSAEVLADLTSAVPGDSWLSQLEIHVLDDDPILKFTAITPAAALLVDRLESAPHIERVELQSSSTAGLATERDRVELSAHWVKPTLAASAAGAP